MTASIDAYDYLPEGIESADLGHPFTGRELRSQCQILMGGIAWPGRRPGFAAVLALGKQIYTDGANFVLLDEVDTAGERCPAVV